ncbi:MAG: 5-nucleotidase [Gaiellaceae bacterium]|nr:5-nucleotidase [Gaiellaceae bacterium]
MEPEPFIQTISGRRVNPFALTSADIDICDIAQALANQCRFGGHCRRFYSVAQHSCLVADLVGAQGGDKTARLWALLHDAPEAYLSDLPHPMKHFGEFGRLYREAEDRLQSVISEHFGLPREPSRALRDADRALLAAERLTLMADAWEWPELRGVQPADIEIDPWPPEQAASEFLSRYRMLRDGRARERL